ncbi:putative uncharacterized protein encoded by LINC00269 [Piliocolobus tephrosceles]|uniref:putative uncharacterized protein encoded by LINC00269 n=1 Tax=Piliocolobus tephrosceles TaxID=591936 RepID=UPI000C2A2DDE|nr:putative uncharacterized protein encoded by LINC00269 [Piliocolobus tephrosceles]
MHNFPHNCDALCFDIKNAVCRSNIPLNTQLSEMVSHRKDWRRDLALLPRPEYSGVITAHCSLDLLGSSDPLALAQQVAETRAALMRKLKQKIQSKFHQATQRGMVEPGETMKSRLSH